MKRRMTLVELERVAQKPDHTRVGNWMARRVARPAALRVTWLIAPWGVSAHAATCIALLTAMAAAAALAGGCATSWLAAAALLQLWYLLDHVDGQLARLNGTASLDGVALDYLMHHAVTMIVPLAAGMGLFTASCEPWWLVVGAVWSTAGTANSLRNDARYKAFFQRLKRTDGRLVVVCGGVCRSSEAGHGLTRVLGVAWWLARKAGEPHVTISAIGVVALTAWLANDSTLVLARVYTACMAILSIVVAVAGVARDTSGGQVEREFEQWFRPPEGSALALDQGRWRVIASGSAKAPAPAAVDSGKRV